MTRAWGLRVVVDTYLLDDRRSLRWTAGFFRAVLLAILIVPSLCLAQGQAEESAYRLGRGDVLQLSVWQQPDLDRELRVRADGSVVVPLVGEIIAGGLTVGELEAEVARKLRAFNRDITEVSLTVTEHNSLEVFVMGAVQRPGAYTFDKPPSAWDALRAAGGVAGNANLRRTRIMRLLEDGTTRTIEVDLNGLSSGKIPKGGIPPLLPGDTMIIPDIENSVAFGRDSGVRVMGRVVNPGFYAIDEPTPLLNVVLRAGGFRDGAELGAVKIVHLTEDGTEFARQINTRDYYDRGRPEANPMIYPGDTVFVDSQTSPLSLMNIVSSTAGLAAIVVNFFLFR